MPANRPGFQDLKHYGAVSAASTLALIPTNSKRVAPNNPQRTLLAIQNTGANPGFLRFAEPVKGDGTDIVMAINQPPLVFDQGDTCPMEAINLASVLGTTWAILEGTTIEETGK